MKRHTAELPDRYRAVLVTHTHWDREWYFSLDEYRFRLVKFFDALLDIVEQEPAYHSFWLDGQTILLDDYLVVRPEQEARLRRAIAGKKILIGPWYILGDEFLVGGEACIRNLLKGMATMRAFGQDNRIGYLPDTFGHISQMPQLLEGFGIDNAVFWRGYRAADLPCSETRWQGADGTTVTAICLVRGYSNACGLGARQVALQSSMADQPERLEQTLAMLKEKACDGYLLLMNGIDHSLPARNIAEKIRELRKRHPELTVRHGSLAGYLKGVRKRVSRKAGLHGELSYRPSLDATLSSRIGQKQQNRGLEDLLVSYAEPLASMAWREGHAYPGGFLARAWQLLIKNHPHDTICGCHSNNVAQDAATRFRRGGEVASGVVREAFTALTGQSNRDVAAGAECSVSVFNPLCWARRSTWEMVVDLPEACEPGSIALEHAGGLVPCQIIGSEVVTRRCFQDYFNPLVQTVNRLHLLAAAHPLPALSLSSFRILCDHPATLPALVTVTSSKPSITIRNKHLSATISADGTVDLVHRQTGAAMKHCHQLTVEADHGDLYCFKKGPRGQAESSNEGKATTALCRPPQRKRGGNDHLAAWRLFYSRNLPNDIAR